MGQMNVSLSQILAGCTVEEILAALTPEQQTAMAAKLRTMSSTTLREMSANSETARQKRINDARSKTGI